MGGESLLQHTVRKRTAANVRLLLQTCQKTSTRFGLVEDLYGHTALQVALKNEKKPVVRQLLAALTISENRPALRCFMRHRVEIARKHPEMFLAFLKNLRLTNEENDESENAVGAGAGFGGGGAAAAAVALLASSVDLVVTGAESYNAEGLWEDLLSNAVHHHTANAVGSAVIRNRRTLDTPRPRTLLALPDPNGGRKRYRADGEVDMRRLLKVEVVQLRVPLEGAVSSRRDASGALICHGHEEALLSLIAHAAMVANDFTIYDTILARSILQFKWQSYAGRIFLWQFKGYLILVFFVCVQAFGLPRYVVGPLAEPSQAGFRMLTLASLVVSTFGSFIALLFELRGLIIDGRSSYFRSFWKYVDLLTFSLQSVLPVVLSYAGVTSMAGVHLSSVTVFFFCFRTLAYARGFAKWGSLVRIIEKTIVDVQHFLLVMLILILGFVMGFVGLHESPSATLMWTLSMSVFGDIPVWAEGLTMWEHGSWGGDALLFAHNLLYIFMMFLIALILLNLLIAVMNDSYVSVRDIAVFEVAREQSLLAIDIERFWLPIFADYLRIDLEICFPEWLHILCPTGVLDTAAQQRGASRRASG